jgi:hypothetical protein
LCTSLFKICVPPYLKFVYLPISNSLISSCILYFFFQFLFVKQFQPYDTQNINILLSGGSGSQRLWFFWEKKSILSSNTILYTIWKKYACRPRHEIISPDKKFIMVTMKMVEVWNIFIICLGRDYLIFIAV